MSKSIKKNVARWFFVTLLALSIAGTTITPSVFADNECSTTGSSHCG